MSEKKGFLGGLFGGKKGGSGCCNMEIVEEPEGGSCCGGTAEQKAEPACCCTGPVETYEADKGDGTGTLNSVKVLGPGCKNCHALLESTQAALKEIGSAVAVEYVTDMAIVANYGVMSTPALVVNEQVVSSGRVLKAGDVVKLLHKLGF
jgi:small redox-active disulfide protein 2